MMSTALKICGLQSVEVLKSMINLPVDYIGFVFAKSRRRVTPQQAAQLVQVLREWEHDKIPAAVGVLVNPDLSELAELLQETALDVVQLHGQESPQFCREVKERFPVSVFKAVSIGSDRPEAERLSALDSYAGCIDGLLIDTYDPVYGGGSGKTFAWDLIPAYQQWAERQGIPLFVAGGLDPDNVAHLIGQYAPYGVDVSSGVESEPGVKDINKVTAFVERVKGK
ncbi:phosphoribosylanthranilate isomerase [Paenibacillus sp. JNUCC32]|uniref:phosphoribosylanthranilate isomerase n=1 Tax=Paenibacillus TaxID=44249 RepID=UPI000BBD7DF4|nr:MULTISPECIES: phosphoribosylanthranilate isomerase [Paenibacillus]PCL94737.1 N-(5'-phosphoribosyl)anthranilate isomerase [Paenibacillus lautus]QOT13123.1 phosphoribosylanthranilate isomerase [Paenibacillus sp. JNUCC-32]GIP02316.1 N-(5'-phosphoribosyl)anthranilate isomerase [Paenibacillus lautus]